MKMFYSSSFMEGLAQYLVNPFIPLFAIYLGASKMLVGLISSLPTFVGLISQSIGGCVSETVKNKKLIVVICGIFWSLLWLPIALVSNPYSLLALLVLQAFFSSFVVPAWVFMFVQLTPAFRRGEVSGSLSFYTALGSLIGNFAAGFILNRYGFIYFVFVLSCTFGVISKLLLIPLRQPSFPTKSIGDALAATFTLKELKENKKLLNLTKAMLFFNFAVAIASPFFSIHIVQNIGGTLLDVALISAIGIIANMAFYRSWGTLVDYLGAKSVMLGCLLPISLVPVVYTLSNHVIWIYLYSIFGQMAWAGFNVAAFVYLSNSLPKENGAASVGMYNMITKAGTAIAPLLGGLLAEVAGIKFVLLLSFILRLISFNFLNMIEEKKGLKLQGLLKVGSQVFSPFYTFEVFVYTYSMLVERMAKTVMKNIKRKTHST